MKNQQPKVLIFDIESAGVNALNADLGFVIVFGYKWLHEKRAHSITVSQQDLRSFNDKPLLKKASKLLTEADITVAHFGSVFDRRFIQGRLLINNLPPIPNTKMRDTCMISRSVAKFSSNRLKHLANIFQLRNRKLENNWPTAWFKVMQGNMKALRGLAHYCEGDVLALEELYLRLRPFDNAHPRIITDRSKCPVCGGHIHYRGTAIANNLVYRRFQCQKCNKWSRETISVRQNGINKKRRK
jgi:uncharacterized protein YprB with RNaseH-like and TPR domain